MACSKDSEHRLKACDSFDGSCSSCTPHSSVRFSPVSMTNVNSVDSLENLLSCRAQVCDRCRKLKKRCYGTGPSCTNCLVAGTPCVVTKTLKRKRKPKATKLTPTEVENIKLKLKIQELENYMRESDGAMHSSKDMRHSLVKLEDINYHSLNSSQKNSRRNSGMHSPVSNEDIGMASKDAITRSASQTDFEVESDTKVDIDCSASLQNNAKSRKKTIHNVTSSNFKYLIKTRSLKVDLSLMSSMTKVLLPNEDNYNGSAIIEEYSIVDNFLQQDFVKILKEQKANIKHYLNRFFTEINVLFPIILEKEYMLMKADELIQSVDIRNFNTNVINDEHNLCIVYKVILISMFYIKDTNLRNSYLKTVKHLLSRFEFLDPINTLKCYLLTHLFAQMSNNKPMLVRTNGLISSMAINLRINKFKECNELKRELWYVCYCFDFFSNDPNNLDYSLNRYFNDMDLVDDVNGKETSEVPIDSCDSMRMIHDHSIIAEMGGYKFVLQVIDVKRAVYSNDISIFSAMKQMLNLSELRNLSHIDDLQNETKEAVSEFNKEDYKYDFHVCFAVLYYMDALICFENSYVKSLCGKADLDSLNNHPTISRHLKSLFNYIEIMLRLWTTNLEVYDYIPLINVNKLLHYGIFIHWYGTEKATLNSNKQGSGMLQDKTIKLLNMVEYLLNMHTFMDDGIKNCRDVISGLLQEMMEKKSDRSVDGTESKNPLRPFKKIRIDDINDINKFSENLPLNDDTSLTDDKIEVNELLHGPRGSKKYELVSLPYAKCDGTDDVENQLNDYVSGFTFDTKNESPKTSNDFLLHHDEDNTSSSMKRTDGEGLFSGISEAADLKVINIRANDLFK